jgi:hypothetical protein
MYATKRMDEGRSAGARRFFRPGLERLEERCPPSCAINPQL